VFLPSYVNCFPSFDGSCFCFTVLVKIDLLPWTYIPSFVSYTALGYTYHAEEISGTWLFVVFFSYPWLLSIYPISGNCWTFDPNNFLLLYCYSVYLCLCDNFLSKKRRWVITFNDLMLHVGGIVISFGSKDGLC
jgi:hypothetical protein